MTLGEKIKSLRLAKGWSQEFLAQQIDATNQRVSKYEHDVNVPTLDVLKNLAQVFEVSLDYLVFDKKHSITNDKMFRDYFQIVDKLPQRKKKLIKDMIKAVVEST